eukprot:7637457-Pyramimonas_sp.AAC.1
MAAQALQAPRPASLGARVQQAHAKARQVENKLEGAVLKFETVEQQVDAQRRHDTSPEELQQSEKEHSDLVRLLHAQLAALPEPDAPPSKLSIDDILDPFQTRAVTGPFGGGYPEDR